MPIVEPHLYADTPIFREMLYERDGRFPGTPEEGEGGEVYTPEPLPDLPPGRYAASLIQVLPLGLKPLIQIETPDREFPDMVELVNVSRD